MDRVIDAARVVATFGLDDGARLPTTPLAVSRWSATFDALRGQRMLGLLDAAVTAGFPVTADQAAELTAALEAQAVDLLALDSMLLGVLDDLDATGIEARVLKGPGFARRFYARPEWRAYGDVDLLVRGRSWDAAAARLVELGCSRRYDEPRPGFTARFGKGASFVTPSNLEIDLHRTFVAGPFGVGFDPDVLFEDVAHVRIADRSVPVLADAFSAVHAAMHAVLGSPEPRWYPLRDVVEIARSGIATDEVVAAAARIRARWPLAFALRRAATDLGLEPRSELERWAAAYRPSAREVRAVEVYRATDRRYSRQALAALGAVDGWRARAEYALALAWPERTYRERRGQSPLGRAGATVRLARERRAR